jgi:hypothetical protein
MYPLIYNIIKKNLPFRFLMHFLTSLQVLYPLDFREVGDRNFTTFSISGHNVGSEIFATSISDIIVGGFISRIHGSEVNYS